MAITVGNIIEVITELAQLDSSFYPKTRLYYNLALKHLVLNNDLPRFQKRAAPALFLQGITEYSLPEDYIRPDYLRLIRAGQNVGEIRLLEKYDFDRLRVNPSVGVPSMAYIDPPTGKIIFESSPSGSDYSYELNYFRKPVEIDVSGGDDANAPDFDDENLIIEKTLERYFKYNDDERFGMQKQEVQQNLQSYKTNNTPTNTESRVQFGPSNFKAGRRPTRGGGGGWFSND